jgi:hypothetical protein
VSTCCTIVPEGFWAALDDERLEGALEMLEARDELEIEEALLLEEGTERTLDADELKWKRFISSLARLLRLDMFRDSALIVELAATSVLALEL